jgi:TetR/AcrR family transcriptional regulator, cholesterol catabolism regulator
MTAEAMATETPHAEQTLAPDVSQRPVLSAILNAALEAFAKAGFYGASVRDVAKGAGTSLSNLYNYFPSKSDLLVAVLQNANEDMQNSITVSVQAAGNSATERVTAAVSGLVRFAIDQRYAAQISMSEIRYLSGPQRDALVASRDETQQMIECIVNEGVHTGEFSTPSPKDATRAILTMCMAIAGWHRSEGSHPVEYFERLYASYALGILRSTPLPT